MDRNMASISWRSLSNHFSRMSFKSFKSTCEYGATSSVIFATACLSGLWTPRTSRASGTSSFASSFDSGFLRRSKHRLMACTCSSDKSKPDLRRSRYCAASDRKPHSSPRTPDPSSWSSPTLSLSVTCVICAMSPAAELRRRPRPPFLGRGFGSGAFASGSGAFGKEARVWEIQFCTSGGLVLDTSHSGRLLYPSVTPSIRLRSLIRATIGCSSGSSSKLPGHM
mmetsp:Transcript_44888/g.106737  ORF Transcript_44888/g.106737 Transcript_44888/m.106737 type:complete len:224 (-) Transcript_44888:243-914(-)